MCGQFTVAYYYLSLLKCLQEISKELFLCKERKWNALQCFNNMKKQIILKSYECVQNK